MLLISTLTVLSQVNLTKEDKIIIANTFIQNNALKQELDTCNSINDDYKERIVFKDSIITLKDSKILQKDGLIVEKTILITGLTDELKQAKKTAILNKVNTYLVVGGITVSFTGLLYILIKK